MEMLSTREFISLMDLFPVIVVLGAALIGWVGGETIISDAVLAPVLAANRWLRCAAATAGAVLVVGLGKALHRRTQEASPPA